MKTLYLFIHTLLENELSVGLFDKKSLIDRVDCQTPARHSKILLNLIDKLLKRNKIKLNNLKGIAVTSGPGSFTSIRLGLAAANTLAYLLKIPAVGVELNEFDSFDDLVKIGKTKLASAKKGQLALPSYGREPNITKARVSVKI